jgi:hypothetical protein
MANAKTEITDHGIILCQKREVNKVRLFRCTFDTLSSDLEILAADAAKNNIIVGLSYSTAAAHRLIIKSGATQRVQFDLPVNSGIFQRVGNPIVATDKNAALNLRVETGLITDLLIWVVQSANFAAEV